MMCVGWCYKRWREGPQLEIITACITAGHADNPSAWVARHETCRTVRWRMSAKAGHFHLTWSTQRVGCISHVGITTVSRWSVGWVLWCFCKSQCWRCDLPSFTASVLAGTYSKSGYYGIEYGLYAVCSLVVERQVSGLRYLRNMVLLLGGWCRGFPRWHLGDFLEPTRRNETHTTWVFRRFERWRPRHLGGAMGDPPPPVSREKRLL